MDRLESKFDARFTSHDSRFDTLEAKFDGNFDSLEAKFEGKFDSLEAKFDRGFTSLEGKLDRKFAWLLSVGIAATAGIFGAMARGLGGCSAGMTRLYEARAVLAASHRTAVFSGAGLSAESGIATFRGNDGHALWSQLDCSSWSARAPRSTRRQASSSRRRRPAARSSPSIRSRRARCGAEHIELVGPASVVLPQLLEGLSEIGR